MLLYPQALMTQIIIHKLSNNGQASVFTALWCTVSIHSHVSFNKEMIQLILDSVSSIFWVKNL